MVALLTDSDQDVSISVKDNAGAEPSQFLATDKAIVEGMAPLDLRQSTASVAQEVTIRQVAPLVLVLTGATFLHVRVLIPCPKSVLTNQRPYQPKLLSLPCPLFLVI